MKLARIPGGGYACASDEMLAFRRLPFGPRQWQLRQFRVRGHRSRHEHVGLYPTLSQAVEQARPLWQPYFMSQLVRLFQGDGLALWQAAVRGDEASFLLALDWAADNFPDPYSAQVVIGRDWLLSRARACGMFLPPRGSRRVD